MKQFLEFMRHVRETGVIKHDRTGTGTYSVFGSQMRFDISGYKLPLLTTKHCHLKSIIHELLWFLRGTGETDYLNAHRVTIWDEWTRNKVFTDMTVGERMGLVRGNNAKAINEAFDKFRNTLYSEEEVAGWEFMPLQGKYRAPNINETLHQWIDENTTVSRLKLVKGDLGPVYGVQWRAWPIAKEDGPVTYRTAVRYIESIGNLDELRQQFIELDVGTLDLWMTMNVRNTARMAADELRVDQVVISWLREHGKSVTELVTVKAIDQIAKLIELLRTNPDSRRMLVSAWNPADLGEMALEPCHSMFQFWSRELNKEEMVDAIFRSPLLRTADSELFDAIEADVDRSAYMELDEVTIRDWMKLHNLPIRGLSCQLYQR